MFRLGFALCVAVAAGLLDAEQASADPIEIVYNFGGMNDPAPTTFSPSPSLGVGNEPTISANAFSGILTQSNLGLGISLQDVGSSLLQFRIDPNSFPSGQMNPQLGTFELLDLTFNNTNGDITNVKIESITFAGFLLESDNPAAADAQFSVDGNPPVPVDFDATFDGFFGLGPGAIPIGDGSVIRFSPVAFTGNNNDAFAVVQIRLSADLQTTALPEPSAVWMWFVLLAVAGVFVSLRR